MVLFIICSAVAEGIPADNPHLVLLFFMSQLFLRELAKCHRLVQVIPMDMSGYYGKSTSYFNCIVNNPSLIEYWNRSKFVTALLRDDLSNLKWRQMHKSSKSQCLSFRCYRRLIKFVEWIKDKKSNISIDASANFPVLEYILRQLNRMRSGHSKCNDRLAVRLTYLDKRGLSTSPDLTVDHYSKPSNTSSQRHSRIKR